MKKIFATDRQDHKVPDDYLTAPFQESLEAIYYNPKFTDVDAIFPIDYETTGLVATINSPLLVSINTYDCLYTFDLTENSYLAPLSDFKGAWLAHNMQFDYAFMRATNISTNRLYCSMLADQVVNRGFQFSASLLEIHKRYLKLVPESMDKGIRDEFANKKLTEPFTKAQIKYANTDVLHLRELFFKIMEIAKKRGVDKYLYNIAFPLISIVSDSVHRGIPFNKDKWIESIKADIVDRRKIQRQLDLERNRLVDVLKPEGLAKSFFTGKNSRVRNEITLHDVPNDLFGNPTSKSEKERKRETAIENKTYTNWNSTPQKIEIFNNLGLPIPTVEEYGRDKESFGKDAMNQYLIEYPDDYPTKLARNLLEYSRLNASVNKTGYNFIDEYYKDGLVYTSYRTETALTGRFQSGSKNQAFFNSQNIPRDNRKRNCFHGFDDDVVWIGDLGSAEGVIMASHAQDRTMMKYLDDLHSFLATKCWRAIYTQRAGKWRHNPEKYEKLLKEANDFTVSKSVNKHLRQNFKAITYGIPYGAFPNKISKSLNVTESEGTLVKSTVEKVIPKVTRYMESNVIQGLNDGYIIFNERNNLRMSFLPVILAKKTCRRTGSMYNHRMIDFKDRKDIEGNCRNAPIQATQAEMMKEAMIEIVRVLKANGIVDGVKLLMMVHDELVYSIKKELVDVPITMQLDLVNKKGNFLSHRGWENKGEVVTYPLHKFLAECMKQVSNRYLLNIKMDIDYELNDCWKK